MPEAVHRLPRRDAVAITIDDAPSGAVLTDILQSSGDLKLQLTWFVRGDQAERHPNRVREIISAGHQVGSHGYRHVAPVFRGAQYVRADISRSLNVIERSTGIRPVLYRPPYGRMNPMFARIPSEYGCQTVLWSHMPDDWDNTVSMSTLEHRLRDVRGGDIVVLHEHAGQTERLLRCIEILADVLALKGLRSLTIR
jgi:peptidoglycan/xylan/chitin deacetylase (PgdA/CDA1 family)